MKKAVFICDKPNKFREVFTADMIKRIGKLTELDTALYSRADVLACPERFAETEYIFSTWGMPVFSTNEIRNCFPSLKCLFYAAGTVQKFARPFLECECHVFSAWAANAVPVAEYTVSQILLANKGFFTHAYLMNRRQVAESKRLNAVYPGNYNVKIGLIGCGMIGSLVAEMLGQYKTEVMVFDPFLPPEKAAKLGVTVASLDQIFSCCSVVSNHLANNAQTQAMLNYSHFSALPPYATFINTGRGAQVVESDLVRALTERPDLTALLDVTYPEPAELSHPFYDLPNCFLTPHIAGSLGNEVHRMAEYMYDEFVNFTSGMPCCWEVTEKMLETMA
ncbi:MAG: hydroxyacid dehydrogenase [Clostridia bacterium]|nr:hydroxyacid dehydrogenase [Clostridia bacterium]